MYLHLMRISIIAHLLAALCFIALGILTGIKIGYGNSIDINVYYIWFGNTLFISSFIGAIFKALSRLIENEPFEFLEFCSLILWTILFAFYFGFRAGFALA